MQLIRGLHNLRDSHRGCVATIGNFDGVHLGHQTVLGQLAEQSATMCLPSLVMTFEPYPQEYFAQAEIPPRLTRFREKIKVMSRYALDRLLCVKFNAALAGMPPQVFIQRILIDALDVRYLVVGDDFRFGYKRRGDFAMLQQAGAEHGFKVAHLHTFEVDGERVSSTRVRQTLAIGDVTTAGKLLGRPYRMSGRVAHGDKRGRTIGFPTANIHLHRKASPVQGVFAVEMFGIDGEPVKGVANVGNRPTVDGTRSLLEVHLFDFAQEIYGAHVSIEFAQRIRAEKKFASFDELKKQIELDVESARAFFASRN